MENGTKMQRRASQTLLRDKRKIDSLNVEFSFLSALMSVYFIAVNADYPFHRLDLFLPYLRRELMEKRKYQ